MNVKQIKDLIATDNLICFYKSTEWKRLRVEVLREDHYECQSCKERGRYSKATTVHHVNYIKKHPELALSKRYVNGDGLSKRQLVSLCHECHEEVHGHRRKEKTKPLTEERW